MELSDKVRFDIAVSDDFVDPTITALCEGARTGEVGDGKIFVLPLERAVRIRTGETDKAAVTPVGCLMPETEINTGDTAWMLMATALVLFMTIGLGLFYAGLVRSKNSLNTFMMCIAALGVVTITWALIGYSFAFGGGGGFIGELRPRVPEGRRASRARRRTRTIPHLVFFAFQASFCIITAALISGAVVERMRFLPYLGFIALWSIFVYPIMAHWVFGRRLPRRERHARLRGRRARSRWRRASPRSPLRSSSAGALDYGRQALLPHNTVFVLLGAGLLWFGWFGFNGGSGIGTGQNSVLAFIEHAADARRARS